MKSDTKEVIEQLISYYNYHSIEKFVRGKEDRLKGFVIDDFRELLALLEKELHDENS